ncbi:MAG: alpha/beta hydrolase [Firmicutes bacterium]|nr:alpha/beta hydrolase [Bacillota bacterium]MBQ1525021.1 alpha/beta hydrolase [Bacillota bacterium]MBQ1887308.1 alpha/beta hydrolase [Bacillota bacterium]MBQ4181647.1 alpha/beta hydrolase [Bacillota bacterium]MBQ4235084.1 alpha/beta hydrolase [Bacillota bacterium]
MSKDRLESRFFPVAPGVELHYIEKGEGRPIIFIPGLTFPAEIFSAQVNYFSRRYRAIAIDPRGQGYSSKTVDGNDYMTHGRDLAALINGLGLKDVVLVGWSTGNLDVWSYARQFTSARLHAAVTIDMSPLPLSPDPKWWTEGTMEELSEAATTVMTSPEGVRAFFSDYAKNIMIQKKLDDSELEYILDLSARTPYWICKALFCDAIFSNYLKTAADLCKEIPCLMFIAEHWAGIAKPFTEKHLPGCRTFVMGGHLMFYEYPEMWNAVLDRFLDTL